MLNVTLLECHIVELLLTVHSYSPCRLKLVLRMVSEKSPLSNRLAFQLKPDSVFGMPLLKEATLEPLLVQLTWMRDISVGPGRVTLHGRVALALRPACISLGDTVKRGRRKNTEPLSISIQPRSLLQQGRGRKPRETF